MRTTPTIAIIGAGFGGLGLAILLQKAGIDDFKLYERAASLGGVWRDNCYPGAACDIPSHLYSFSFEHRYPWSRRYAPQAEILAYLDHCADKYAIRERIVFDTDIDEAIFDEERGVWSLSCRGTPIATASILVSAVGQFSHPFVPTIPGRDIFAGPQFHSSRWDRHFDLRDRRVALVGTGASTIQIGPAIASVVKQLAIFQRSAPYVFPKGPDAYDVQDRARLARYPLLRSIDRLRIYGSYERRIPRRRSDRLVAGSRAAFMAFLSSRNLDAERLRQATPDHPWGCKRVLLSNDWYETLARPNVTVVEDAITRLERGGIRTADGALHEADAIIYGTGFAPAEFLKGVHVVGVGGRVLSQVWQDGAEAYKGVSVAGFPNFFLMFGPNTNIPGSVVYMLESQARYIVRAVRALRHRGARYAVVRPDAQQTYNDRLQRDLKKTIWATGECKSWFKAASGKITTQWPGFLFAYRHLLRRIRWRDYDVVP